MQTYKVTGHKVILGVGITLKLTEAQANTRTHCLKQKKKGIYTILEPVQLKQNEVFTIVSGNVSKAVLANLEDTSKDSKKQDQATKDSTANNKKPDTNTSAPKGNSKKKDEDKTDDSQPNIGTEKIINNGDINSLPVTTK